MKQKLAGFSLLELAIAVAITGALGAGVLGVVSLSTQRANHADSQEIIHEVEEALISFARANSRLPCSDTSGTDTATGNGIENCSSPQTAGQIPYRTLGLPEPPLDAWNRPILYAMDRRFVSGHSNRYSFCQSIRSRMEAELNPDQLHSIRSDVPDENLAYLLLSGGGRDVSGNGRRIDQVLPFGVTYQFFAEDHSGGTVTDDLYAVSSLYALAGTLRCAGELVSTNSIENEIIAARLTIKNLEMSVATADDNIDGVARQISMAGVQILTGAVNVAAAAASLINAIGQGLVGNGAAVAAGTAAVAGAGAGITAITAAAIDIADAVKMQEDMELRLDTLKTYQQGVENLCEAARVEVIAIKGDAQSCQP